MKSHYTTLLLEPGVACAVRATRITGPPLFFNGTLYVLNLCIQCILQIFKGMFLETEEEAGNYHLLKLV